MRSRVTARGWLLGASAVSVALAAAWIGYSRVAIPHRLRLPPALHGKRRETRGRAGRLSHYVAGEGPPLLLIHSINAAGSAYEVRPIFERLAVRRRVYAVDLPGFGFSDRRARRYDVPLFVDALHDMLEVIEEEHGGVPVDALALSLSAEFLARAALERPARFRSLTLVAPTGFMSRDSRRVGPPGSNREIPGVAGVAGARPWSRALFDLLSSGPSIRFFLERTFGSSNIDEGLWHYDYLTSHQPDAQHAVYAFLCGRLFSRDMRRVYERLTLPIWVPHGVRGDFENLSGAHWTARRKNWRFRRFATGAMPQFEQPSEFARAFESFLEDCGAAVLSGDIAASPPAVADAPGWAR